MQIYPKKHMVVLMIAVIITSLIFAILVQLLDKIQLSSGHVSAEWLLVWKVVATISILYSFARLWFWPQRMMNRIAALPSEAERSSRRMSPEIGVLLLCYGVLVSPDLYGLVLFYLGLPVVQFYYFASASIGGALVWGLYNFTKS
jgi:hypothetical protein